MSNYSDDYEKRRKEDEDRRKREEEEEDDRRLLNMCMGDMLNTGIPGGIDFNIFTPF